ncbi:hypothetical protein BASA81_002059 [Batrachochytrium salamandrivorans]|nr:hypothetical protein BASA81_002059 [Batrachochytrium salamandrivorans]
MMDLVLHIEIIISVTVSIVIAVARIIHSFQDEERFLNSLQFATRLGLLKIDGVGSGPRKNNQRSRIFDVAKVRAHFKMGGECMF